MEVLLQLGDRILMDYLYIFLILIGLLKIGKYLGRTIFSIIKIITLIWIVLFLIDKVSL